MSGIHNLQKGQKLVLGRDFDREVRASASADGVTLPEIGQVYTVRDTVGIAGFGNIIFLVEIMNPKKFYLDAFDIVEQGFDPTRFRLVDAEKALDEARCQALASAGATADWGEAAVESYKRFVESQIALETGSWAAIASLWQPNGGDA